MKIGNKIRLIFELCIVAVLILVLFFVKKTYEDKIRLQNVKESLLLLNENISSELYRYKVSDSLNVSRIYALQLTLNDYERYKKQDAEIIKRLQIKNRNLENIIDFQANTIAAFSGHVYDSIIHDTGMNNIDTLKCFDYLSKWTDVHGCIDIIRDTASISVINRESLLITEVVKYKRFLGFLWKTRKVLSRHIDVVSKNPSTTITKVEYINLH